MNLLDILTRASLAMGSVKVILQRIIADYPDTAAQLQPIVDGLDAPVSQANLVALAEALPREIANIASGNIDPRPHAGDAV